LIYRCFLSTDVLTFIICRVAKYYARDKCLPERAAWMSVYLEKAQVLLLKSGDIA
jgi:hypothetical protein